MPKNSPYPNPNKTGIEASGLNQSGLRGGLKTHGLGPVSAIPDSVENQYPAEDFESPWPDQVGDADMSVTGLSKTTLNGSDVVTADGQDDHGVSDILDLGGQQTWGFAMTFATSVSGDDFPQIIGISDTSFDNSLSIIIRDTGVISYQWTINDNQTRVTSSDAVNDGELKSIIINKNGDAADDIEIYVEDMTTDESSISSDANLDSSNWPLDDSYGIYARRVTDGTVDQNIAADAGVFEFSNQPYSQSEREDFISRRPEV